MSFDLMMELNREFFLAMVDTTDKLCGTFNLSDVAYPTHFEADAMYCAHA